MLKVLQDAYPREPLPEDTLELYARMLLDLPVDLARRAVLAVIASRPYPTPPTIGEIRQAAARLILHAPTAAEALAEVRDQIREASGIYGSPRFSHPAIARAVDAIGWHNICQTQEPEVMHAQFIRVYEMVVDSWTAALADAQPSPWRQQVLAMLARAGPLELPSAAEGGSKDGERGGVERGRP